MEKEVGGVEERLPVLDPAEAGDNPLTVEDTDPQETTEEGTIKAKVIKMETMGETMLKLHQPTATTKKEDGQEEVVPVTEHPPTTTQWISTSTLNQTGTDTLIELTAMEVKGWSSLGNVSKKSINRNANLLCPLTLRISNFRLAGRYQIMMNSKRKDT